MATFQMDDWVEVTRKEDKRWSIWKPGLHDLFCGKICQIVGIGDDEDTGTLMLQLDYKGKFAWFRDDHVIMSTGYDEERQAWFDEKGKELQEWENKKKEVTDEMLRHIFAPPSRSSVTRGFFEDASNYLNPEENIDDTDIEEDRANEWEEPTESSIAPYPAAVVSNVKDKLVEFTDEELEELLASISGLLPDQES